MTNDAFTIQECMLPVGEGHELYVHEWGNKTAAKTFLFLHGGPGSGCSDSHKTYFDGTRDHVIFFDQRGAGNSTPHGSLVANTTQDLVEDIEKILAKFNLEQVVTVGGSWGTTLSLAYAVAHPEKVTAMVLRGLFTGAQAEIDFMHDGTFRWFFPDAWEAFVNTVPAAYRNNPSAYHAARALGDDAEAAVDSTYAYRELEGSISTLDDRHAPVLREDFQPYGGQIEIHYLVNHCFMEDRYLMDRLHTLTMPVWIINGRYDNVCPPSIAFEAHRLLPNSELIYTIAGHSANDRGNFDAVRAVISSLLNL